MAIFNDVSKLFLACNIALAAIGNNQFIVRLLKSIDSNSKFWFLQNLQTDHMIIDDRLVHKLDWNHMMKYRTYKYLNIMWENVRFISIWFFPNLFPYRHGYWTAIWVYKNMFGIQKIVQKRFYSVLNRVFSNKKRPRRTTRNNHQRLNEVGTI